MTQETRHNAMAMIDCVKNCRRVLLFHSEFAYRTKQEKHIANRMAIKGVSLRLGMFPSYLGERAPL